MGLFGRAVNAVEHALSRDYRAAFRTHCHVLIQTGYECVRRENHSESDEDDITMRLVDEIGAFLRSDTCPRWGRRYCVRDQAPQSILATPARCRPKVDIEMESLSRGRPLYHFEAKRLRRNGNSAMAYLGREGLGCFLSARYGRGSTEGGMLGYVQSDSPAAWARGLSRVLTSGAEFQLVKGPQWSAVAIPGGPSDVFSTYHTRDGLPDITILHSFLDFR